MQTETKALEQWQNVLLLTSSEYAVFLLLGEGMSTKEVAKKIYRSHKTVETHYSNIRRKLKHPHLDFTRCYAARFRALVGTPKMVERRRFSSFELETTNQN